MMCLAILMLMLGVTVVVIVVVVAGMMPICIGRGVPRRSVSTDSSPWAIDSHCEIIEHADFL
jgi:hypothetical protein